MRAVAYVRVSSKGQNLRLQRHAIDQAAAARGDVVEYRQEKQSAATLARPILDEIRREVVAGKIKRLYVFRLDRLTRSGIRDTFEIIDTFRGCGCEVVSCADGFDLNGPLAEPLIAVMAWAAKMELSARGERIAAARARKEAAGEPWGRPPRMTPRQRQKAISLRDAKHSQREIATRIKVPRATVGRFLRSLEKP